MHRFGRATIRLCLPLAALVMVCWPGGCASRDYKGQADDQVYKIIDAKWEDDFGSKANFRISDTEPLAEDVRAERAAPASGVLTLPAAVAIATTHNRDYQTQKELLYTTALDLRLVRHGFENQLFGGGSAFYSGNGVDEAVGLEANVGFNRLLATGTRISTQVAERWVDVLLGIGGGDGLASVFSATVSQPLLRGSDREVVLEGLTQAERDTLYEIRRFNRFRKTFVVSVITQYYGVLERLELAERAESYYQTLSDLRDRVEHLTAVGRVPLLETDRLHQEMLRSHDAHLMMQTEYERALDAFKITLGLPTTLDFTLDPHALDTLKSSGLPDPDFVVSEAIETALRRRLDMANSADSVIDAQRGVRVAADGLRAGLNIVGRTEVDSRGNQSGTVGAALDLPLDRVAEQTVYRKALITLSQRQRDYDLAADTVRLEIREAHRKLTEAAQRYHALSEALQLAQERLRKTSVLLQYGRASSRRVLSAQEDLYEAQNAATNARIDYAVATLNFYRDTGVLHVRPDGMWERGASDIGVIRGQAAMMPK